MSDFNTLSYGASASIRCGWGDVLALVALMISSMRGETGAPAKLFPAAIATVRHFTVVNALVSFEIVHAGKAFRALGKGTGEWLVGFSDGGRRGQGRRENGCGE